MAETRDLLTSEEIECLPLSKQGEAERRVAADRFFRQTGMTVEEAQRRGREAFLQYFGGDGR